MTVMHCNVKLSIKSAFSVKLNAGLVVKVHLLRSVQLYLQIQLVPRSKHTPFRL